MLFNNYFQGQWPWLYVSFILDSDQTIQTILFKLRLKVKITVQLYDVKFPKPKNQKRLAWQ